MDEESALLSSDSKEYVPPRRSFLHVVYQYLKRHLIRLISEIPGMKGLLNRFYTMKAAEAGRNRPYALSCKSPYASWESLTDYSFYGRHLPPAPEEYTKSLPPVDEVVKLFERPKGVQTLCPKSTMLFPTFAQHLIDSFIVTQTKKSPTEADTQFIWEETRTSHDIGLIPLYGRSFEQTRALRLKSNETGRLGRLKTQIIHGEEWAPFLYKADGTFSDKDFKVLDEPQGFDHIISKVGRSDDYNKIKSKIFAFGGERTNTTPQIVSLNTLFLREHNRIAGEVEKTNPTWDDERVFQTARNILIVIYLKLVIEEYINHITSLGVTFKVEPKPWVWNAPWYKRNWISAEFSVLYRWHALVPNTEVWGSSTITPLQAVFHNNLLLDEIGSLRSAFLDISKSRATTMQCFNTAQWMLGREKAALEQSRQTELRPFADYMVYLGLDAPKTFEDISSYPEIAAKLRELYGTPDRVEFYVGLVASDLPVRLFCL
jgi:prostaglandin-endoperoxide synthase 2